VSGCTSVDAAYGGSVALLEDERHLVAGWEHADSIVLNPHKWLSVPLECSVLFTRKPDVLRNAFSLIPEYLRTEHTGAGATVDYMDYGLTLGRRFRALKLWFVLRYFGAEGLAARIRMHLRLARWLAREIDGHPRFERAAPVPLSTVCFRVRANDVAEADRLTERLMQAVNATGRVYVSHARLNGRLVLRVPIIGVAVEERHVRQAWELMQEKLNEIVNADT
jgi:aromatic-L-amino-acid decarboxylase